ncbi:hypothetical protein CRUP_036230 [Coryphaenoides rupestris]|nr:hypothetical protein CRUP_036230 [Coryphaenoides rupestris]
MTVTPPSPGGRFTQLRRASQAGSVHTWGESLEGKRLDTSFTAGGDGVECSLRSKRPRRLSGLLGSSGVRAFPGLGPGGPLPSVGLTAGVCRLASLWLRLSSRLCCCSLKPFCFCRASVIHRGPCSFSWSRALSRECRLCREGFSGMLMEGKKDFFSLGSSSLGVCAWLLLCRRATAELSSTTSPCSLPKGSGSLPVLWATTSLGSTLGSGEGGALDTTAVGLGDPCGAPGLERKAPGVGDASEKCAPAPSLTDEGGLGVSENTGVLSGVESGSMGVRGEGTPSKLSPALSEFLLESPNFFLAGVMENLALADMVFLRLECGNEDWFASSPPGPSLLLALLLLRSRPSLVVSRGSCHLLTLLQDPRNGHPLQILARRGAHCGTASRLMDSMVPLGGRTLLDLGDFTGVLCAGAGWLAVSLASVAMVTAHLGLNASLFCFTLFSTKRKNKNQASKHIAGHDAVNAHERYKLHKVIGSW